jgi:hypothetical protein
MASSQLESMNTSIICALSQSRDRRKQKMSKQRNTPTELLASMLTVVPQPKRMKYYDLKKNWRHVKRHLADKVLNDILVADFNKFTFGSWKQEFTSGQFPSDFETMDWYSEHRGRRSAFWKYTKAGACHWLVNFNLRLAMLVMPTRPWRIITSDKHSTVWDSDKTIFEFNFQALGIDPAECFSLAFEVIGSPGEYLAVPFACPVGLRRWRRRQRGTRTGMRQPQNSPETYRPNKHDLKMSRFVIRCATDAPIITKKRKSKMTRWYTSITVYGQCRDLDEFCDTYYFADVHDDTDFADVHDDTVDLDLNSVVPMPAEIAGGTKAAQIAWQMENWGCSGNAYANDDGSDDDYRHSSFDFLTDDGPPEKVFEAMARRFPSLEFIIYSVDMQDTSTRSGRYLKDGRIIDVHKVPDLDTEIRERIRPDMTEQEKRQLAWWCASEKDLLEVGVWLEEIERVAEEAEAQNLRPDKVLLS